MDLIAELESHYEKKLTDFTKQLYEARLSVLSPEQIQLAVTRCIVKYPLGYRFFPSPEQLLELVRGDAPPGENWKKQAQNALPSEELNMSEEQRLENIRRFNEMAKSIVAKRRMNRETA